MKSGASFWENCFLEDCEIIFHAIIPTVFTTQCSTERPKTNDKLVEKAQELNLICVKCQKICQNGEPVRICVRAVFGRKDQVYRAGFGTALICSSCEELQKMPSLDSDSNMHEVLFQLLEILFLKLKSQKKIMSGEELLDLLMTKVYEQHDELVRLVGKINNQCGFCKKSSLSLKRCAGCNYYRYCDNVCADADWKRIHKKECKKLQAMSFIFPKLLIKIK